MDEFPDAAVASNAAVLSCRIHVNMNTNELK